MPAAAPRDFEMNEVVVVMMRWPPFSKQKELLVNSERSNLQQKKINEFRESNR